MIRVKLAAIDMYGLNGRDKHPRATDFGRSGYVVSTEVIDMMDDDQPTLTMLTVTLDDNAVDVRTVEVAEYEVAEIKIVTD